MKYAQYISETQINTTLPKKGYDEQGRLVVGDLRNRPDVLALMKFYPLIEEPVPSEIVDGHHYEMRYRQEDSTVIKYWISVEDPPAPPEPAKSYSKIKILLAAQNAGFIDSLVEFIESDKTVELIWNASNTIENNELFKQYLPLISQSLGKTESEVLAFLDEYCVAD